MATVISMNASVVQTLTDDISTNFGAGEQAENMIETVMNELACFAVGYILIQIFTHFGLIPQLKFLSFALPTKTAKSSCSDRRATLKALTVAASAGHFDGVLDAWDREKNKGSMPLPVLKDVAQALCKLRPSGVAKNLTAHISRFSKSYAQPSTMNSLVEHIAENGHPELASELVEVMRADLSVYPNPRTRELLVEGFAAAGENGRANEELAAEATLQGVACVIRGCVKSGNLEVAVEQITAAVQKQIKVSPRSVAEVLRSAHANGISTVENVLDKISNRVEIPVDSIVPLLVDCLQNQNVKVAKKLDALVSQQEDKLPYIVYEPLLKIYAKAGISRGVVMFEQMLDDGLFASEGLCGNLLARCGEAQNLRFADSIIAYLRSRSMMTLAIFKTLMKVYATCNLYGKACDLYEQVLAEGIEPDQVMYGCLVKFAVKCGRTELSRELVGKTTGTDVQNYMWMIRAASRDGDVDKAFALLRDVEKSQDRVADAAMYNATVDACVSNGRMPEGRRLLKEMAAKGLANLVTYNTLMKGCSVKGDIRSARGVLREMEDAGMVPDSASYNCLMGAMVSAENYSETTSLIDEMDRKGVSIDHYTVSIMMKVVKKANQRDSHRALAVLERFDGMKLHEDEVLFNTLLDALIHRRYIDRLGVVLQDFDVANVKPSVQTYGLLIKAFSLLKKTSRCWELWRDMVQTRGITPNAITLSCMLDAIICARQSEQAVNLLEEWKKKVPTNTVMYSTLIKGFASVGDAERAMDMFRALRSDGLQMNLVAYTSLIDAHARVGRMSTAMEIFDAMQDEGCEPNVITYSAIIKGYCKEGNLSEAEHMFEKMLNRGLAADAVIFNTLLDGCVRHSCFDLADNLLANMGAYKVQTTNYTISIIIKMWGKRRRLDLAFDTVNTNLKEGRILDPQVGTCLLSACFHNQSPAKAMQAFREMKQWKGFEGPDENAHSTLIQGLVRAGAARDAFDVAMEACDAMAKRWRPMKPLPEDCVRDLVQGMRHAGLFEELDLVTRKFRSAGLRVPNVNFRNGAGNPATYRRNVPLPGGSWRTPVQASEPGSLTGGNKGLKPSAMLKPSWAGN